MTSIKVDQALKFKNGAATRVEFQCTADNEIVVVPASGDRVYATGMTNDLNRAAAASSPHQMLKNHEITAVTFSGGGTVKLPLISDAGSHKYHIVDEAGGAGANSITVQPHDTDSSAVISGSATIQISSNYNAVTLYSNGTDWFIM